MLRDAVEKGNRECSGQFILFYLKQGERTAQQWLLLLEPFAVLAAATSGQRSRESEEWDSTST